MVLYIYGIATESLLFQYFMLKWPTLFPIHIMCVSPGRCVYSVLSSTTFLTNFAHTDGYLYGIYHTTLLTVEVVRSVVYGKSIK